MLSSSRCYLAALRQHTSRNSLRMFTSPAFPHVHVTKLEEIDKAAVSYLPDPKPSSRSIVGWAPLNKSGQDVDLSQPRHFDVHPAFLRALEEVCLAHAHEDPVLQAVAATQDSGHLHIADEKNPPDYGRIPYPEDIIGTVRVQHGQVVPRSFRAMREAFRPASIHGIVKLPAYLESKLLSLLKAEEGA